MKPDINFLRALRKELRFLKPEEKEKFISKFRKEIDNRYRKGEEYSDIINSFETPKEIATKIYQKYPFDVENIAKNAKPNHYTVKWLSSILSTLPQVLIFILSILLFLSGILVGLATFFAFALCWVNFDPIQAIGPALLALGLIPLIAYGLFWSGRQLFKMESWIFKAIWKALTSKEIRIKTSAKASSKIKKILSVTLITFCSVLTLGGVTGSFAGEKTIGYSGITGNLIHNQTETLDLAKWSQSEPVDISYNSLKEISWYKFVFNQDSTSGTDIKISRDYNTKESIKLKYTVEEKDGKLNLKVNVPWNILALGISSNKFTIWYNPKNFEFLH